MTDLEMLHQAFDLLERSGFETRRAEACCNTCTLSTISGDGPYAYWHEQDEEHIDDEGYIKDGIYIGHGPDTAAAERLRIALESVGLKVTWDGDATKRVRVVTSRTGLPAVPSTLEGNRGRDQNLYKPGSVDA